MKTNVKIVRTLMLLFLILVTGKIFSQNDSVALNSNKTDASVQEVQVSFLPFISFNGSPLNSTVNLSFNILGGYVKEVRELEIGSIINIDEKNAGKCQLAGVGNVVGGVSSGFQSAGVFNFAASQKGVQAGGVLNVVAHDAGPCQIAGDANVVCGSFNGFQAAGVINVAKSLNGVQVAGVLNTVFKDAKSSQIAGVGNVTAGSFEGCQIGGVFNYATKVTGAQISGLLNVTTLMKGTQVSFMNISDSCQGMPIGFFSFVAKGYHQLEFSADEVFYTNIAFRTGVRHFHNIFIAGIRPGDFGSPLWTVGYGLGTMFGNPDKLSYNIDLVSQQVNKGDFSRFDSELCKLYLGFDKKIGRKASITAGLTYNVFITATHAKYYNDEVSKIAPYTLSNQTYSNGVNIKTWIGAKIGVRLF